ncbi:hypothetical protein GX865_02125 [Candidatus Saccharibacteria bacterium]|jgi:hypothetical protein|nr:hypothetical protein [Candidatus Saccharibacteria bacterium]
MPPYNSPEYQKNQNQPHERTEDEINESNLRHNDYLDSLMGSSSFDSEDVANSMTLEARESLGANYSISGSGMEGFKEGIEEANQVLTQGDATESANFSRSVEIAKSNVLDALSSAGIDEVDHDDVSERVLGAKYEEAARGREVVGRSEFLSQDAQDQVADAIVAEKVMKDVESGDVDTIEYVNQLMNESESVVDLAWQSKEVGGVERLDNARLAEVGKDIRSRNLTVEGVAESAQSLDLDSLDETNVDNYKNSIG